MRKTLFLIIFFLFSTLAAEAAADKNEAVKAPKFFYFEPAIGIKTGLPVPLGAVVDMNFDFLVHSTEKMPTFIWGSTSVSDTITGNYMRMMIMIKTKKMFWSS